MPCTTRHVVALVAVFFVFVGIRPSVAHAEDIAIVEEIPAETIQPEVTPEAEAIAMDGEPVSEEAAIAAEEAELAAAEALLDEGAQLDEETQALMAGAGEEEAPGTSTTIKTVLPQADDASGALVYAYPIKIPPGRNGLQPDLKLTYSSQANGLVGWLGHGWDIPIPSIERTAKKGSQTFYTDPTFISSLAGEIVKTASGTYATRFESGEFLSHTFNGTSWTVKDKKGTTYLFGSASSSRLDASGTNSWIVRWMLTEVRDTNDNYIKYEYFKDAGQIYPSKIIYTGHGSTDGPFEIEFLRESRSDHPTQYMGGFTVTTNYRISEIRVKIDGVWSRKYVLSYDVGDAGYRTLLGTITETGRDELTSVTTTLPAQNHTYQTRTDGWTLDNNYTFPKETHCWDADESDNPAMEFVDNSANQQGVRIADVNGDGLADILLSRKHNESCAYDIAVHLNKGDGTGWVKSTWTIPVPFVGDTQLKDYWGAQFVEVNGDGLADIIYSGEYAGNVNGVYINNGSGWSLDANYIWPEDNSSTQEYTGTPVKFRDGNGKDQGLRAVDVNGDGLTDLLKNVYSGYDGTSVTMTWLNKGDGTGWARDTHWRSPVPFTDSTNWRDTWGAQFADLNNDGLVDIFWSNAQAGAPYEDRFYLNTGNDWEGNFAYSMPDGTTSGQSLFFADSDGKQRGVKVADLNADGFPDLIQSFDWMGETWDHFGVFFNKANGTGWNRDVTYIPPVAFLEASNSTDRLGTQLVDLDGDALPEIIWSGTWSGSRSYGVYTKNGLVVDDLSRLTYPHGGKTDVSYKGTAEYRSGNGQANQNLPYSLQVVQKTVDDDGFGTTSTTWRSYEGGKDWYGGPFDHRFAGFSRILSDTASNTNITYFHQGDASATGTGEYLDHYSKIGRAYRTEVVDSSSNTHSITVNKWDRSSQGTGPGVSFDAASSFDVSGSSTQQSHTVTGSNAALICGITANGGDHITGITWNGSALTQMDKRQPRANAAWRYLFALNGAASGAHTISVSSASGTGTGLARCASYAGVSSSSFPHAQGYLTGYTPLVAQGSATTTVEGATLVVFAANDDGNWNQPAMNATPRGAASSQQIFDSGSPVPAGITTISLTGQISRPWTWQELALLPATNTPILTERSFVRRVQKTELTYDGDSDHKDRAESYAYDVSNGNLAQRIFWGEVTGSTDGNFSDTGSDMLVLDIAYATNTTDYVIGHPSRETVSNQGWAKVRETKYYYDTQSHGNVTDGNLTKEERWKSGSSYIDTEKTYNAYGLVTQEKDPRDKTTTYAYDAQNLYPTTVTNPLSHVFTRVHDYSSGLVRSATDPNLLALQTVFDGLDRPLEERQPDQSTSSTAVVKTSNVYTDTSLAANVKSTDWLDGSNGVDTWTYLDGFDRPLQARKESETAGVYAVSDLAYNNRALLLKESLPYFSSGSSKTTAATNSALYSTYAYDAQKRVTSVVNGVGTTSYAFDDWKTTVTDPRGNVKRLFKDAYDRLSKVEEVYSASSTYATEYEYDGNDSLTKITDALSNIRNFTYDGLGRRLTVQDLHAGGDATYGTWTYTYDDAGNPTTVLDPKSQTVNYTYDDLNRPLAEDYTGQAGTETIFTYDTCQYGKGKPCSAATSSATTTSLYGPTGQATRETKTIAGTGYQTDYAYDRQSNVLTATLPDGAAQQNTYNAAGLIDKVERKESGDGSWTTVVSNFDWSPIATPTLIAYANSATTTNEYDATRLYRLTSKSTVVPGGDRVQHYSYTYDAKGNVASLYDDSDTSTAKNVEYSYDALDRLVAATYYDVGQGSVLTPDTGLTSSPASMTWSSTATFAFHSNDAGATFECNPDSGGWSSCTSPRTYASISAGNHTFSVRAVNAAGNDSTPATRSWQVIGISSTSLVLSATGTCSYGTGCQSGNTFTVPLTVATDDEFLVVDVYQATGSCPGTVTATYNSATFTQVTDTSFSGAYFKEFVLADPSIGTYDLIVTKPAGSCDFEVLAAAFRDVDLSDPNGTRGTNSGGSGGSMSTSVTGLTGGLIYSAFASPNDIDVTANSPLTTVINAANDYPGLMSATATNTGSVTTSFTIASQGCCAYWAIVSTPLRHNALPETTILAGPSGTTWSATGTFSFLSNDGSATFQCKLDAATWTSCTSATTYTGLSIGSHEFQVRAVNANGADASPSSATWTVASMPAAPNQGQESSYTETYGYDALGNILSKSTQSGSSTLVVATYGYASTGYANPHAMTSIGAATLSYDNNGNMTSSGTGTFAWDFTNRLSSSIVAGATSTYAYDHEGTRTSLTDGAGTTRYASKAYSILGTVPTKHIFAGDILIATIEGSTSTAVVRFIHTDHLTGSSVVTSSTGTRIELLDYYPYGGIRLDEKATGYSEVRKFAGLEYDGDTGLNYAGSRYYDAALGRFLSEDPAFLAVGDPRALKEKTGLELEKYLSDPQGHNSYTYARNNPLLYIDPNGKWYLQFSLSGTLFHVSGSIGIRLNAKGFASVKSVGGGLGAGGGMEISYHGTGELSHESESSISRTAQAVVPIVGPFGVGLGVSRTGTYDAADPLGVGGGRDQSSEVFFVVGGGESVSQEREWTGAMHPWSSEPRQETLRGTTSVKDGQGGEITNQSTDPSQDPARPKLKQQQTHRRR